MLTIRGGYLVVAYRNGDHTRMCRVVQKEPGEVRRDRRIVTDCGTAYLTGWVQRLEGPGQSERVAWRDWS